jgi:predicted dehydrogenase
MSSENPEFVPLARRVRCAVIGLGMGRHHAESFLNCPEAELVAVVDMRRDRLELFRDKPGAADLGLFTDHKDMLRAVKPDLVAVALPNCLHKPVTLDALAAGAHVLCEKPMAMTVAEAVAMRDAASAAGLQLGINFSQRFTPAHRALKDIAASGGLGEVYHGYCSWTRRDGFPGFGGWFGQKNLSGGGPLIDLGVHRIDLALWLMGHPEVVSVSGTAHHRIGIPRALKKNAVFDVEDFATGLVRFGNGASLVFEVSWAGHQRQAETRQLRITGTEGAIEQDEESFHHFRRGDAFCTTKIDTEKETARNSVQEMVHCVAAGKPFPGTPDQGIAVQRILDGLYASAATGREVICGESRNRN